MAKTILIVEDNEHFRIILGSMLRSAGYKTIEAETGTEAIQKALSMSPHLILMDLDLPDATGIDVARKLKENPTTAAIPVIACSAWSMREWKEEAMNAGMADYLQKPIPAELLKRTIEKFISR
ncbi:MAG TPA: response regulator [Candidatus Udaeobacter sp.]|jgi:CheY-like chemotaxis protein|nr:response regulator [Candidatus Udaeobacter sp.]